MQVRPAVGLLEVAHLCEVKGANDHRWAGFALAVLLISASFFPRGLHIHLGPNPSLLILAGNLQSPS